MLFPHPGAGVQGVSAAGSGWRDSPGISFTFLLEPGFPEALTFYNLFSLGKHMHIHMYVLIGREDGNEYDIS
jgi:hypothetical protein